MVKRKRGGVLAKRTAQLGEAAAAVASLEERVSQYGRDREKCVLLQSVGEGLYEEMDKLCRKSPVESVTDLAYTDINHFIKEVKELARGDPYVQRTKEFVAAGENPQYRDVVMILRSLRQGLGRFTESIEADRRRMVGLLKLARAIEFALRYYAHNNRAPTKDALKANKVEVPSADWFDEYTEKFDLSRVDRLDIATSLAPEGGNTSGG